MTTEVMDHKLDRKAARIVADALRLLNDGGKHWTKGTFRRALTPYSVGKKQEAAYCAIGALRQAAYGATEPQILDHSPEYLRAREALVEIIGTGRVTEWNDSPYRTWEEVRSAFSKTLRKLRGK